MAGSFRVTKCITDPCLPTTVSGLNKTIGCTFRVFLLFLTERYVIQCIKTLIHVVSVDISTVGEVKKTSSVETYLHTLYKYTNYSIRVLAYTGAGDGVLSPPIFCTTEEDGRDRFC